jgi:glycosyltransferase involved in cell wall biosynthesis
VARPAFDVAYFAPHIGPLLAGVGTTGGGETQVFLVARELAARGWRVGVAALVGSEPLPGNVAGITVIPLPGRPQSGRIASFAWRARLLWRLYRGLDADVIVQRAAGTATALAGLVARLRGRQFVYSSASVADFDFATIAPTPSAARLFRLGIRLADAVVVQSAEQVALCRRAFGRSSELVPSIAEPPELSREPAEALLWIGRFAPYKRPLEFLELAARVPRARFWILGGPSAIDPTLEAEVRRRAAALDNVEMFGALPRPEALGLVRRAVAIVSTSEFEGMPNVFLEGWAHGVPALALAHDPDETIVRERVGWFAESDMERLADQAAAAWDARDDQAALARRCQAYVQRRHSAACVAARWEEILFRTSSGVAGEPSTEAGR